MKKTVLLFVFMFMSFGDVCQATEDGGGAYANGGEDYAVGCCVMPGFYYINYFLFYKASRFNDKNGNNAVPGFDAEAIGNASRFLYITDKKVLGGNWGLHVTVPLIINLTVKAAGAKKHNTGLGDIIIDPFFLGWHRGDLYYAAGVNYYFPTGEFDKTKLSLGRNYYTFEPFVSVSYLAPGEWDLSGIFLYDFNTKNPDTDYLSGQEFHFDYSLARMFDDLSIGVGGYYYCQTTEDKLHGSEVAPEGNKGRAFAMGPEVRYTFEKLHLTIKYQNELIARNRPQGHKVWLKAIYIF